MMVDVLCVKMYNNNGGVYKQTLKKKKTQGEVW